MFSTDTPASFVFLREKLFKDDRCKSQLSTATESSIVDQNFAVKKMREKVAIVQEKILNKVDLRRSFDQRTETT